MAIVTPKGRKHLSADALFRLVHTGFDHIPDYRPADADISLTDALMSAFAMFSLKSPSLLAFDKERAEGNLHTIYGIKRVPCDTQMREILDPVVPKSLRPVFQSVFAQLQRGNALEPMVFLDGCDLLALDGTGYFSSKTMHCASCLHQGHRNGTITYTHQMLGAAIIHPEVRAVIPLMPEPIVKRDGTSKNDGERHAAKRFVSRLRHDHPHLKCIITEDSLSSNAPHIETLHAHHLHSSLGGTEGDHAWLFAQVRAAEHAGRVTSYERHDRAAGLVHRFRFVNDVPLHASNTDVRVNFIEYWEHRRDQVQHFSWVTDLRVSTRNVFHLMRGGRARWKIEHETFNGCLTPSGWMPRMPCCGRGPRLFPATQDFDTVLLFLDHRWLCLHQGGCSPSGNEQPHPSVHRDHKRKSARQALHRCLSCVVLMFTSERGSASPTAPYSSVRTRALGESIPLARHHSLPAMCRPHVSPYLAPLVTADVRNLRRGLLHSEAAL